MAPSNLAGAAPSSQRSTVSATGRGLLPSLAVTASASDGNVDNTAALAADCMNWRRDVMKVVMERVSLKY